MTYLKKSRLSRFTRPAIEKLFVEKSPKIRMEAIKSRKRDGIITYDSIAAIAIHSVFNYPEEWYDIDSFYIDVRKMRTLDFGKTKVFIFHSSIPNPSPNDFILTYITENIDEKYLLEVVNNKETADISFCDAYLKLAETIIDNITRPYGNLEV